MNTAWLNRHRDLAIAVVLLGGAAILPFFFTQGAPFMDDSVTALAYVVMALGLNIVVGFAGLLDLGYVAFFAIGAYTCGWLASGFADKVNNGEGIHIGVSDFVENLPGIHLNFLLIVLAAIITTAIAGVVIGLPTLRLRGDYIAIVTLAFGEIIRVIALNGNEIHIAGYKLTNGAQGITPVDKLELPFAEQFTSLEPETLVLDGAWAWWRSSCSSTSGCATLASAGRGSRSARTRSPRRAWACRSCGRSCSPTRPGPRSAGSPGAFLGSYLNTVNADQFQFSFSIFVLAMVILGGLGNIWGVVLGAVVLSFVNTYLIPDVLNEMPDKVGLDFDLTELSFGIFGFLLVIMMVLRPEGLLPERRRKLEMAGIGAGDTAGVGGGEPEAFFEVKQ